MGTPWDARTYDRSSQPQQAWASEVLARLEGIAQDATVLDIGCGTGRVTEMLPALVTAGRVLAVDASDEMVAIARRRLGDRATVWCQDVLDLELEEPGRIARASRLQRRSWSVTQCSVAVETIASAAVQLPLDYVRLNASAVRKSRLTSVRAAVLTRVAR